MEGGKIIPNIIKVPKSTWMGTKRNQHLFKTKSQDVDKSKSLDEDKTSPQLPDDVGQLICSLLDPLRHHSHKTKTSPPSKARRGHWVNSSAAYLTHGGTLSIKPKKALRSKLEKQTWNNSAMEAILTKLNPNENGHKKALRSKSKSELYRHWGIT